LAGAADYRKLAEDQGLSVADFNYPICLSNGEWVPIDLEGVADCFKLIADQKRPEAQDDSGI
jgi:TPR repeat protein